MSIFKRSIIWIIISSIIAIVSLFFVFGDSKTSEFLQAVALLIISIAYVNLFAYLKKRTSEKTEKGISVLQFFLLDKSMLCIGLGLLFFTSKMILQWLGAPENITISLHLAALGCIILASALRHVKSKENQEVSSS